METDVCVMQSAISLLENGFKVMALLDAVATTDWDEHVGIGRMRDAGVMIGSVKSLFYEWIRSVGIIDRLDARYPDLRKKRPASLVL
jgi:nicotinamidase-related amidase